MLDELDDRYGEPPAAVRGLVDISLIRIVAAGLGIYEIGQRQDALLMYTDTLGRRDLTPLTRALPGRISLSRTAKPYLAVRLKPGEKPIEIMRKVFDVLNEAEK
ncbi:hypothetical protein SDC9_162464 [bioreactor metagenome]|uniref:Transcription-repair-coupling factor C-terminal domain-containing protein n=1 Tax=bioreactor metagenome TaxID=1076179 RepID=A0A645FL63_9ZZZZ